MGSSTFSIIVKARNEAARALGAAIKQVEKIEGAVARTGKQAERATTGLRGMSRQLDGIGRKLPMLIGSGGLAYGLKKTADVAFQANAQMMVFERTVLAFGQSLSESKRILNEVAERLQVAPEQIAASASLMLRAGYDMREVAASFTAGAASALAAGKSVQSGIENVSLALSTGLSIYLNYIGIAENIGPVIRRAINAHKNAAPEIVRAAQNQAALNVVLKATAQEVKALPVLLGGYQGAINRLNVALFNLTKTVGQEVLPPLTALIADLQEMVEWLVRLPAPLKAFAVGTSGASVAVVAFAAALAGVKRIVGVLGGPAGWLMLLISALGGVATVLYNRTIPAVGEGKKALERLAAAAESARGKVHQLNLEQLNMAKNDAMNAYMRGLREIQKEMGNVGPAAQKFIGDLTKAGIEGKPLEGLERTVRRIELYTEYLRNAGRDAEAAPVLDLARHLIELRDYAVALEDATKQLEAYKKAAKGILNQKPHPDENDNDNLDEWAKLWERINNLPVIKSSLLIKANKALGSTPDSMIRNTERAIRDVADALSTISPDALERIQKHAAGITQEFRETERTIHTLFSSGALATAPDTIARIEEHARQVKDLTQKEADAAAEANKKLREQLALWRKIESLPVLKASYWIELSQALGSTPDSVLRNAEHGARRVAEVMGAMSPDTLERLQNRLNGVKKEAIETVKQLQAIFARPEAQVTSPDTLSRIEEHARRAKESAKELAKQNRAAREEAEKLASAYAKAQSTVQTISSAISSLSSASQKSAGGDAKGAFAGMADMMASLALLIPKVGGVISSVIQMIKTLVLSLWDAIADPTGAARAEKTIKGVAQKYTLIGKAAFEAAKEVKKVRYGLFGEKEATIVTINKQALKAAEAIARTLESGVLGALRNGIRAFLDGKADWAQQLRNGIRDAIYNGIIEAVIQAGIFQGMLKKEFTALNKALLEQNWDAAQKYAQDILARIPEVEERVKKIFSDFKIPGGGSAPDAAPGSAMGVYYNLPTAPTIATPPWVDQMGRAIDKFDEAVDRMLAREQRSDTWLGWFTRGAVL